MTDQTWSRWYNDPAGIGQALNPGMEAHELAAQQGNKTYLYKLTVPVLGARCNLTTFYRRDKADGTKVLFHSSQGNEGLRASCAHLHNNDTFMNNRLTYMAWKPYNGGMEITHIVKVNPGGNWLERNAANLFMSKAAGGLLNIVRYLEDGTISGK